MIARTKAHRAAVTLALVLMFGVSAFSQKPVASESTLSVEQQNAIVRRQCAVCHDDVHLNGGLSLQHFDAAHLDPSLAAMIVSKLKNGAMGAAGIGVPDKAT